MSAWPIFDVTVDPFPAMPIAAPTIAKARYEAFTRFQAYDDRVSFRRFLKRCKVRRRLDPVPIDGYDYIRHAYGLNVKIGDRVRVWGEGSNWDGREGSVIYPSGPSTMYVVVVMDGEDRSSNFHPMSVEIIGASEQP